MTNLCDNCKTIIRSGSTKCDSCREQDKIKATLEAKNKEAREKLKGSYCPMCLDELTLNEVYAAHSKEIDNKLCRKHLLQLNARMEEA